MFQFKRVCLPRIAAHQAGALAIAGLLALPLVAIRGGHPVEARVGLPAPQIAGPAEVIDGDTLSIHSVRVRLEGIDAPELEQLCPRAPSGLLSGRTWKCGREASEHLARLVRDRTVRCEIRGVDGYGRQLGLCVAEGLEVNADLVRQGLAWAFVRYSQRYVEVETDARSAKRGIWQTETKPAWVWRAERWQTARAERPSDAAPTDCVIKGNITRSGNVYHMPWDRWYDKTRIETAKGERWFCSEGEAIAAGWRPAITR